MDEISIINLTCQLNSAEAVRIYAKLIINLFGLKVTFLWSYGVQFAQIFVGSNFTTIIDAPEYVDDSTGLNDSKFQTSKKARDPFQLTKFKKDPFYMDVQQSDLHIIL